MGQSQTSNQKSSSKPPLSANAPVDLNESANERSTLENHPEQDGANQSSYRDFQFSARGAIQRPGKGQSSIS